MGKLKRWFWWIAGAIVLWGGVYRLAYVMYFPQPEVMFDANTYSAFAKNLLKGSYSISFGSPAAFYTPGYPLLLAASYKIFGVENYQAVRILQSIMSTFVLVLTGILAWRIFRNRGAVLLALGAGAIYAPFVWANGLILTEVWATLWLTLWLATLPDLDKSQKIGGLILNGIIFGGLLLIRPAPALGFPILIIITSIWRSKDFVTIFKNGLIIGLAAGAIMSPWWIRNYLVFKTFIPFSAEMGNVFLIGTYPRYDSAWDSWPLTAIEWETDRLKIDFGLERIKSNLKAHFWSYSRWYVLDKADYFWKYPYVNVSRGLMPYNWTVLFHRWLVGLALGGTLWLILRNKLEIFAGLIVGFVIYYQLIHQVMVAIDRLTFPIMGVVIVFAAGFLWKIIAAIWQLNNKQKIVRSMVFKLLGLALLVLVFANSRFRQPSLLQFFPPDVVNIMSYLRYGFIALFVYMFMFVILGSINSRTNITFKLLFAALALFVSMKIPASSFWSSPKCVITTCPEEIVEESIRPGETVMKWIDLPEWFDENQKTEVIIFASGIGEKLAVEAGRDEWETMLNSGTRQEYRNEVDSKEWRDKVLVTIKNLGQNDVRLAKNERKNWGLSCREKDCGMAGSWLIGLTQKNVSLWYGSSNFEVRKRLLIESK